MTAVQLLLDQGGASMCYLDVTQCRNVETIQCKTVIGIRYLVIVFTSLVATTYMKVLASMGDAI
jgi:hypothetical protein